MKKLSNKIKHFGLYIGIVLSSLIALNFTTSDDFFEISKNLSIFTEIYKDISVMYVDQTQPGELMKTGIDAMLKSLDPYTVYIPESEIEDYRFMISGEYGGIGALIREKDNEIIIAEPYENFPAQKSGLKAGDVILKIDGKIISGKTTSEVSDVLKGQADSEIKLSIKRGDNEPMDVVLNREEIKIPDVPYYGMVNDSIGYIKLTSFTQTAAKQVKDGLVELKSQGMKKVIFDLRNNGGGLLMQAVDIVNLFMPKGLNVVETKGRINEMNNTYKTINSAWDADIPLVILVNDGSASASEIVSGSIQDFDRGIIIGQRTYGKGLVQQTKDVDFGAKVKLTIAKYYIPSGRCIQELDYANKENGHAIEVPDSLRKSFKTIHGRDVYDGRGIAPDIVLPELNFGEITKTLVQKQLIFDYASIYFNKHSTIADPKHFKLTDEEYNDFITFLSDKDYSYATDTEKELKNLKKIAIEEKYFEGSEDNYSNLVKSMSADKKNDLHKFKDEILMILENEIISRYYYQKGRVELSLRSDSFIDSAVSVLNDPLHYNTILNLNNN